MIVKARGSKISIKVKPNRDGGPINKYEEEDPEPKLIDDEDPWNINNEVADKRNK